MLGLVHRQLRLITVKHSLYRLLSSTTAVLMVPAINSAPDIHRVSECAHSLDRTLFLRLVPVLALSVPASKTGSIVARLNKSMLDLPRMQRVVPDTQKIENRLVLLNYQKKDELPADIADFIENEGVTLTKHTITFNYDYWTTDDILKAVLPENLSEECIHGFSAMGHLAHMNLKKEYLPYKYIIGQVILDKNPRIRTIVNKLDTVHTQFRVFDMELIAGEPDFVVELSESNCRFTFDFRQVYWNSRLHTEHARLVNIFQPEDGIIADVMAGVGPFAVPAAKKGCAVLANDLNPNSTRWLLKNVIDNNVLSSLRMYCEDGRDFIRSSFRRALTESFPPYTGKTLTKSQQQREERKKRRNRAKGGADEPKKSPTPSEQAMRKRIAHFVMNLPESAIEFLDAFRGVLDPTDKEVISLYEVLPLVHCYCFTRFLDRREAEADIRERAEAVLGSKLEDEVTLHYVRSVSPGKDMYCISFRLPRSVAVRQ